MTLTANLSKVVMCTGATAYNYGITIGYNAKSSGFYCVTIGRDTQANHDMGVAIGSYAYLLGTYSVAIGAGNGSSSAARAANKGVAIGSYSNADGTSSVCVGGHTYSAINAVAIGAYAEAFGGTSVAIGNGATTNANEGNYFQLGGNSSLSVLRSRVALTVASDERDKADIIPLSKSLDFINAVKPIQYVKNERALYMSDEPEDDVMEMKKKYGLYGYDKEAHESGDKKGSRKRAGVSAQQVEEVLKSVYGTDNYADIVNDNLYEAGEIPDGVESQKTVNYTGFIPFLIQAVQELTKRVEYLESKLK